MPDNGYNIIKPVESPHNIGALAPAKRREERKKRQDLHEQDEEEPQQELNESTEENFNNEIPENQTEQHPDSAGIDYCA